MENEEEFLDDEQEQEEEKDPKTKKAKDKKAKKNQNQKRNFDVLNDGKKLSQEELDKMKMLEEGLKQTQATLQVLEEEKFFKEEVDRIKQEYKDFDLQSVLDEIDKIAKEDEALALQYNTPVGFRAIWLKLEAQKEKNDPVNKGKSGGGEDIESLYKGALNDEQGALRKLIDKSI